MLQKLRDKTSGWIASAILGLLTIPFAFFGVEQYMQQQNEDWVAKVEAPPTWWAGAPNVWPVSYLWAKDEINSRDWRQQLERVRAEQRQQLGDNYDPQAFEDRALVVDRVERLRIVVVAELLALFLARLFEARAAVLRGDLFLRPHRRQPMRRIGPPGRRRFDFRHPRRVGLLHVLLDAEEGAPADPASCHARKRSCAA